MYIKYIEYIDEINNYYFKKQIDLKELFFNDHNNYFICKY